jgi:D-cysteine desulfhydrase family pyridoxal phosphate-dependent enzyme
MLLEKLSVFPELDIGGYPTPIEPLPRLGAALGVELWVKRDDCTRVLMGGNKVRQLAFYLGQAVAEDATDILITGAVQSNFARTAAAVAASIGMQCHVQYEDRVPDTSASYHSNGNVLLENLLGVKTYSYPHGEDEAGADAAIDAIAAKLKVQGKRPYIIPLGANHPPLGALGYVKAAMEISAQLEFRRGFDAIYVGSGSGQTHSGLLFGLRALGQETTINGICVRRNADQQHARIKTRLGDLARLLEMENPVSADQISVDSSVLSPGYGQMSDAVTEAIRMTAELEGIFLDPVYTGKTMAGLIAAARGGQIDGDRVLFWHTGGQGALFGYGEHFQKP